MFNALTKTFSALGKQTSTEYFQKACVKVTEARTAVTEAGKFAIKGVGNFAATAAQVGLAFSNHKIISGEIISDNSVLQAGAKLSNYYEPNTNVTKLLNYAATATGIAAKTLVNYPTASLGFTVASSLLIHPQYVKATAVNTSKALYKTGEAAYSAGVAGVDVAIGSGLLAKEGVESAKYHLDSYYLDRQNGMGSEDKNLFQRIVNIKADDVKADNTEEINLLSSNFSDIEDDWVEVYGENSSVESANNDFVM